MTTEYFCDKCGEKTINRLYVIKWTDVDDWLKLHEFLLCFSCKLKFDKWMEEKTYKTHWLGRKVNPKAKSYQKTDKYKAYQRAYHQRMKKAAGNDLRS